MAYLVPSQAQGRRDINQAYPKRLTERRYTDSDGWIGDSNHKPPSDHLPDSSGAVRATDTDTDAIPDPMVVVAAMCAHPATRYVILHDRISHRNNGFRAAKYTGAYHHHIHRSTEHTSTADNNTSSLRLSGVAAGTVPVQYIAETGTGGGIAAFPTVRQSGWAFAAARTLQRAANKLGARLDIDGIPGPRTIAWVRQFQRNIGLDVDGQVGPNTWSAVAQALLNLNGQKLVVDGDFGSKSRAATVAVQRMYGLAPDGWFGPKTLARLLA